MRFSFEIRWPWKDNKRWADYWRKVAEKNHHQTLRYYQELVKANKGIRRLRAKVDRLKAEDYAQNAPTPAVREIAERCYHDVVSMLKIGGQVELDDKRITRIEQACEEAVNGYFELLCKEVGVSTTALAIRKFKDLIADRDRLQAEVERLEKDTPVHEPGRD